MEFKSLKNIESSFRQIRLFGIVFLSLVRRAGADRPAAPRAELRHARAEQEERAHGLHDGKVHHPRRQVPRGGAERKERRSPPVLRD